MSTTIPSGVEAGPSSSMAGRGTYDFAALERRSARPRPRWPRAARSRGSGPLDRRSPRDLESRRDRAGVAPRDRSVRGRRSGPLVFQQQTAAVSAQQAPVREPPAAIVEHGPSSRPRGMSAQRASSSFSACHDASPTSTSLEHARVHAQPGHPLGERASPASPLRVQLAELRDHLLPHARPSRADRTRSQYSWVSPVVRTVLRRRYTSAASPSAVVLLGPPIHGADWHDTAHRRRRDGGWRAGAQRRVRIGLRNRESAGRRAPSPSVLRPRGRCRRRPARWCRRSRPRSRSSAAVRRGSGASHRTRRRGRAGRP